MTISDGNNIIQYIGNNATSVYSTGSIIFYDQSDLIVTQTVIATGVNTLLTLGTDYTVSGGSGAAGSITLTAGALASTKKITIEVSIPYSQTNSFVEGENIFAKTIEQALDKSVVRDQQLRNSVNRALKFSPTLSTSLVGVINEAPIDGRALLWDGTTGSVKTSQSDISLLEGTAQDILDNLTDIQNAALIVDGFLTDNNTWSGNNTFTGSNIFQGLIDVTNVNAETTAGIALRTNGGTNCLTLGAGGSANLTLGGNMSGASTHKLVSMADPTSAQDYATKNYVDSLVKTIHVRRQETSGTVGGSATSGSLQNLTFNTTVTNTISGASRSGNNVSLPAGTYIASGLAPFYRTDGAYIQLYNVTDATQISQGCNTFSSSSDGGTMFSHVNAVFTLTSTKEVTLRYRVVTGGNASNLGTAKSMASVNEVYNELIITRVA